MVPDWLAQSFIVDRVWFWDELLNVSDSLLYLVFSERCRVVRTPFELDGSAASVITASCCLNKYDRSFGQSSHHVCMYRTWIEFV